MSADDSLPEDIATLKAMLVAERAARLAAEAKARSAEAEAHARALQIEKLKFAIAKLRHQRFEQSAERGALILSYSLPTSKRTRPRPKRRPRCGERDERRCRSGARL